MVAEGWDLHVPYTLRNVPFLWRVRDARIERGPEVDGRAYMALRSVGLIEDSAATFSLPVGLSLTPSAAGRIWCATIGKREG